MVVAPSKNSIISQASQYLLHLRGQYLVLEGLRYPLSKYVQVDHLVVVIQMLALVGAYDI